MKNLKVNVKTALAHVAKGLSIKLGLVTAFMFVLTACSGDYSSKIEARATFELNRVYVNAQEVEVLETNYMGSTLTFIGPENGGNVLIRVGETVVQASINPSREHPSFESGYWHHHLYSGSTAAGSPRINFSEQLPDLGLDDPADATNHTQSAYQRGNLHYVVEASEFRLRFTIDGVIHDLMFTEV